MSINTAEGRSRKLGLSSLKEEQIMAQLNPIQAEKLLKGLNSPANKQEIVKYAEEHEAVREALNH
jgi:hypothetical protein